MSVQLAVRNLSRQKRRTATLIVAIAFCVMIVSLINGFTGSFIENVSENFSQILAGHIFVQGFEKNADAERQIGKVTDDEIISRIIDESGIPVRFISRRSEFQGQMIFQGNSVSQSVVGADWDREQFIKERVVLAEGDFAGMTQANEAGKRNGIIISTGIAERLKVEIGDILSVKLRTVYGQENLGEFRLAGISYDPGLLANISAYADLDYVNELLGLGPDEYQTMGIFVDSVENIEKHFDILVPALSKELNLFPRDEAITASTNPFLDLFTKAIEETWDGVRYKADTLNDRLAEIQQIVGVLNGASLVILLVLFFIIMVGITNTFRMIMLERVKEIGTIRALGMQRGKVLTLFLWEAALLGLLGCVIGLAAAGVIMLVVGSIDQGLSSQFAILMKNGYFTFKLDILQALLHFTLVTGLTIVSAWFPSRKAAMMSPVEALRN